MCLMTLSQPSHSPAPVCSLINFHCLYEVLDPVLSSDSENFHQIEKDVQTDLSNQVIRSDQARWFVRELPEVWNSAEPT